MNALAILGTLLGGVSSLEGFLVRVGDESPALKPRADEWLKALRAVPSPQNLAKLAAAIPGELLNIAQGKVDPRSHPSDAV